MTKKYLLLCIVITISAVANAQSFVRVYNSKGHKIAGGKLIESSCTDSTLVLKDGLSTDGIAIQNIAYIKTKHSVGNNILVGIGLNAPLGAVIGSANSNDEGYAALGGLVAGALVGTIEGLLSSLGKSSHTYKIKGDRQQWRSVRIALANK